jgi:hypothetical protein
VECRWNAGGGSVLGAIRSAHEAIVGASTGCWFDVLVIDANRRGAEKAHRYGFRNVVDFEGRTYASTPSAFSTI